MNIGERVKNRLGVFYVTIISVGLLFLAFAGGTVWVPMMIRGETTPWYAWITGPGVVAVLGGIGLWLLCIVMNRNRNNTAEHDPPMQWDEPPLVQ